MENNIRFREIEEADHDQLKELHDQLFPVKYSETFFRNISQKQGLDGQPILSCIAVDINTCRIVGFVIAQFVNYRQCEDEGILDPAADEICYIMTIGTRPDQARNGIGSELLHRIVNAAKANLHCGAVYLHVITYNLAAMQFYSKNSFQQLRTLHRFYSINAQSYDAHLYILYLRHFRPPVMFRLFRSIGALLTSFFLFINQLLTALRNSSSSDNQGSAITDTRHPSRYEQERSADE